MFQFLFGRPREKFSLENLQYLYGILVKNALVTDSNREVVVETVRAISELLIWGDQHNPIFFEFFLEKNILMQFARYVAQQGSGKTVRLQVLQTLSILIQNLSSDMAVYYMLSNNTLNELILHKGFDLDDEELLAYYISFLKTLSLKLNKSTIQFFYNQRTKTFPLYTEAVKFFRQEEGMIRIAVRTLTLNVYRVDDENMRRFVLEQTYFSELVGSLCQQCRQLDEKILKLSSGQATSRSDNSGGPESGPSSSNQTLKGFVFDVTAEELNQLYYVQDVFSLGVDAVNKSLTDTALQRLLLPLLAASVLPGKPPPENGRHICPLLALYILSHVFFVVTHPPVVNTVALSLFGPRPSKISPSPPAPAPSIQPVPSPAPLVSPRASKQPPMPPTLPLSQRRRSMSSRNKVWQSPGYVNSDLSKTFTPTTTTTISLWSSTSSPSSLSTDAYLKARTMLDEADEPSAPPAPQSLSRSQSMPPITPMPPSPHSSPFRDFHLLPHLHSPDERLVMTTIALLYSIVTNQATDKDLLDSAGLLPFRQRKAKHLLDTLVSSHHSEDGTTGGVDLANSTPAHPMYNVPVVDALLGVLHRPAPHRLITLHITVQLLSDLVYNRQTRQSSLMDHHSRLIQEVVSRSVLALKELLNSTNGDAEMLIGLFEEELRMYKVPSFESLITDPIVLFPTTSIAPSETPLLKRSVGNQRETIRRTIQEFLLLQDLQCLFSTAPASDAAAKVKAIPRLSHPSKGDSVNLTDRNAIPCSVTCWMGQGQAPVLEQAALYLVIDEQWLLLVEAEPTRIGWARIRFVYSLFGLQVVLDKTAAETLHMRIEPAWSLGLQDSPQDVVMTCVFDDRIAASVALQHLVHARELIWDSKRNSILQIISDACAR
mmetsp:Transcript_437/g.749  ORF Transcript_437/g.749 Transcript_437/m.749 type:complete len:883 (+) Transcript_437:92-2740(+)|eukprot:CAMPEP_0184645116 /NCGR_PEP_ID=MMETSP0308-20130426/1658_1 /TAXON_ID=38269 /ORGANISM="Gloeochaete witrockiana, Strain SAG 46.84" /LENGTH=882 /DNA_ID=CAMNT_0027073937 /DNA_START=85 /DNA_END=2733 /DNA_ORIENTATION=+